MRKVGLNARDWAQHHWLGLWLRGSRGRGLPKALLQPQRLFVVLKSTFQVEQIRSFVKSVVKDNLINLILNTGWIRCLNVGVQVRM
jgi:hypothetical protein